MRTTLVGNLKELGRRALAGASSGLVWGFVIGGAGGRLAMFVLRVTTGDSVKGVESDDGFIIGSFTSDTLFLLAAATFAGAAIGIFYVLVRGCCPRSTERYWWLPFSVWPEAPPSSAPMVWTSRC